jgi:tetratricopeptide (TPR) repeat protein
MGANTNSPSISDIKPSTRQEHHQIGQLTFEPTLVIKPRLDKTEIRVSSNISDLRSASGERSIMAQTKTATASPSKRSPKTLAGTITVTDDHSRAQTLSSYEAAVRLMQEGKYDKAKAAFEKMLESGPSDFADRIRMYINACLQQLSREKAAFTSNEERYDYAVSLLNDGNYEDARTEFQVILDRDANADYAFYGLAVLSSMTGDTQKCLEHLTEAIRQNPRNRIQARSDSDFQDMADDPRFTELLYPEV